MNGVHSVSCMHAWSCPYTNSKKDKAAVYRRLPLFFELCSGNKSLYFFILYVCAGTLLTQRIYSGTPVIRYLCTHNLWCNKKVKRIKCFLSCPHKCERNAVADEIRRFAKPHFSFFSFIFPGSASNIFSGLIQRKNRRKERLSQINLGAKPQHLWTVARP